MTRWLARVTLALLVGLVARWMHSVKTTFVGDSFLWIEGHGHETTLLDIIGVSIAVLVIAALAIGAFCALVIAAFGSDDR